MPATSKIGDGWPRERRDGPPAAPEEAPSGSGRRGWRDPPAPRHHPSRLAPGELPFEVLRRVFDSLTGTRRDGRRYSSAQRSRILREFFSQNVAREAREAFAVARLVLPDWDGRRGAYGLQEHRLIEVLIRAYGLHAARGARGSAAEALRRWRREDRGGARGLRGNAGDFAGVLRDELFRDRSLSEGDPNALRVDDVNRMLDELAEQVGNSARQGEVLRELLTRATPEQGYWLVQIVLRRLNIGVSMRAVLDAWDERAYLAFSVGSLSLEEIFNTEAVPAWAGGGGVRLGHSALPQLAREALDPGRAFLVMQRTIAEREAGGEGLRASGTTGSSAAGGPSPPRGERGRLPSRGPGRGPGRGGAARSRSGAEGAAAGAPGRARATDLLGIRGARLMAGTCAAAAARIGSSAAPEPAERPPSPPFLGPPAPFILETKFDGERVQLHVERAMDRPEAVRCRYFSRRMIDHGGRSRYSAMDPVIEKQLQYGEGIVLDGEMVLWNTQKRRFEAYGGIKSFLVAVAEGARSEDELPRGHDAEGDEVEGVASLAPHPSSLAGGAGTLPPLLVGDVILTFVVFDILFADGRSTIDLPLRDRHAIMARVIDGRGEETEAVPLGVAGPTHADRARDPPSPGRRALPAEPGAPGAGPGPSSFDVRLKPVGEGTREARSDVPPAPPPPPRSPSPTPLSREGGATPAGLGRDSPALGRLVALIPSESSFGDQSVSEYVTSAREVERALSAAIARKDEGVVAKDPGSLWRPDDRGGSWIKLKPDYVTTIDVDACIVGCWWGKGRGRRLSRYLVALVDDGQPGTALGGGPHPRAGGSGGRGVPLPSSRRPPRWVTFCRVSSGVTEEERRDILRRLRGHLVDAAMEPPPAALRTVSAFPPDAWVRDISRSVVLTLVSDIRPVTTNKFAAGFSLRFPRIARVRDDRSPASCSTLSHVSERFASIRESHASQGWADALELDMNDEDSAASSEGEERVRVSDGGPGGGDDPGGRETGAGVDRGSGAPVRHPTLPPAGASIGVRRASPASGVAPTLGTSGFSPRVWGGSTALAPLACARDGGPLSPPEPAAEARTGPEGAAGGTVLRGRTVFFTEHLPGHRSKDEARARELGMEVFLSHSKQVTYILSPSEHSPRLAIHAELGRTVVRTSWLHERAPLPPRPADLLALSLADSCGPGPGDACGDPDDSVDLTAEDLRALCTRLLIAGREGKLALELGLEGGSDDGTGGSAVPRGDYGPAGLPRSTSPEVDRSQRPSSLDAARGRRSAAGRGVKRNRRGSPTPPQRRMPSPRWARAVLARHADRLFSGRPGSPETPDAPDALGAEDARVASQARPAWRARPLAGARVLVVDPPAAGARDATPTEVLVAEVAASGARLARLAAACGGAALVSGPDGASATHFVHPEGSAAARLARAVPGTLRGSRGTLGTLADRTLSLATWTPREIMERAGGSFSARCLGPLET